MRVSAGRDEATGPYRHISRTVRGSRRDADAVARDLVAEVLDDGRRLDHDQDLHNLRRIFPYGHTAESDVQPRLEESGPGLARFRLFDTVGDAGDLVGDGRAVGVVLEGGHWSREAPRNPCHVPNRGGTESRDRAAHPSSERRAPVTIGEGSRSGVERPTTLTGLLRPAQQLLVDLVGQITDGLARNARSLHATAVPHGARAHPGGWPLSAVAGPTM